MSRHNDGEKQSMIAVSRGDKKRVGGFPHLEATRPLQGRFCGSPGRIRHTWTMLRGARGDLLGGDERAWFNGYPMNSRITS